MGVYNADGQIATTQVNGSSYTGLYAVDGSINTVINSSSSQQGLYHPCGALNAVVVTDPSASYYNANGSVNVIANNFGGYSLVTPIGGANAPSWLPKAGGSYPVYYADFANGNYWANGSRSSSLSAWLTAVSGSYTRASTAWDLAGNSYANDVARIDTSNGFTLEEARVQYLTSPAAFATQSKSLAAGNYVISVKGSGSVALSGGPTGTATDGSPVSFTLASTTTVTFTLTGSVTWAQCQNQQYTTTPILAATASTTRQADVLTFTPSLLGSAFSVVVSAVVPDGVDNAGGNSNQALFALTGTNSITLVRDRTGTDIRALVNDGTNSSLVTQGLSSDTPVRVAFRAQAQNFGLVVNGNSANEATNTVRNMPSFNIARIGRGNGVQGWNKTIATMAIYPVALSDSNLIIQSTRTGSIAAWGDSLTAGTGVTNAGNKYPAYLGTLFTPSRDVYNGGVGGQTSTQIASRVLADDTYTSRIQVYWAGINNYNGNQSGVLADIAAMVAANKSGKFVVLSLTNGLYSNELSGQTDYNTIIAINNALAATYPSNYVDVRAALIAAYNPANAIDVLNRSADTTPFSLHAVDLSGTITQNIGNTDTSFTTSVVVSAGYVLQIGSEYINILSTSGSTVTNCTRGYAGTTAASYSSGQAWNGTDPRHFNDTGYQIVATQVYNFIQSKGW